MNPLIKHLEMKKDLTRVEMPGTEVFYNWLLEKGKLLKERDKKLEKRILTFDLVSIEPRHCYDNCKFNFDIIKNQISEIEYYEGYYLIGDTPLRHGFLVKKNKIIDITARKFDIRSSDYFGIKIPEYMIYPLFLRDKKRSYTEPCLYKYWMKLKLKGE